MDYPFNSEDDITNVIEDVNEYRELYQQHLKKQHEENAEFLREDPWYVEATKPEPYYFELYAWAVKQVTSTDGWQIISTRENTLSEQYYLDVDVAPDKSESVLIDGRMFLERQSVRYIISLYQYDVVQVAAGTENADVVKEVIQEIENFVKENNFYRGQKLDFNGKLSFIKAGYQDWDEIVLDPVMMDQIRQNTTGFIANTDQWERYGIPVKRGIILGGDPGTGKTLVCKALMSEADGMTCIVTDSICMANPKWIIALFSIADNLSPTLIIIEDIDMIGMERDLFTPSAPPLLTLLAVMDGITESKNIITVGTTNSIDKLDKTLRERPSRFDRIFLFSRPDYDKRVQILRNQAKTIPMSEELIEYIAKKTNQYTPAQLKEIAYGMVISRVSTSRDVVDLCIDDADKVISQMEVSRKNKIGFS
ncbi:MAG TPA: ATP-binding protein [Dehalococcoidia bacterium]|nr:ATP-binding protein [Dehalococcoidia bacterium]